MCRGRHPECEGCRYLYEEAAITGLYLRATGAEDSIETDTSTTIDGKKVFIFTMPYTVYDKADLVGYKLFYIKTVGATMIYGSGVPCLSPAWSSLVSMLW